MPRFETLVAGLGNPLMGDDGIGPAVVARLESRGVPVGLRAVDVGSDVSRLAHIWNGEPSIWLVDAVEAENAPGAMVRLEHSQLVALPGGQSSSHELSVSDNLRWLLHGLPDLRTVEFTLWGVVPESVCHRPTLTVTADRAVDNLASELLRRFEETRLTGSKSKR